ncbi:MAG: hypothetical protein NVSMB55_27870 [Mycobacteriales bacterium]
MRGNQGYPGSWGCLAGLRLREQQGAAKLLSTLRWQPVDVAVAEEAGELGRAWLPSHEGIDGADLAIAANRGLARLLTLNARRFPMLSSLRPAYLRARQCNADGKAGEHLQRQSGHGRRPRDREIPEAGCWRLEALVDLVWQS